MTARAVSYGAVVAPACGAHSGAATRAPLQIGALGSRRRVPVGVISRSLFSDSIALAVGQASGDGAQRTGLPRAGSTAFRAPAGNRDWSDTARAPGRNAACRPCAMRVLLAVPRVLS